MTDPYKQTVLRFGIDGQRDKLIEELLELFEVLLEDKPMMDPAVIGEVADVYNVIQSINVWSQGAVQVMADTKMLRTQIRIKTGYYDA
jgi:hypothetical protein